MPHHTRNAIAHDVARAEGLSRVLVSRDRRTSRRGVGIRSRKARFPKHSEASK